MDASPPHPALTAPSAPHVPHMTPIQVILRHQCNLIPLPVDCYLQILCEMLQWAYEAVIQYTRI